MAPKTDEPPSTDSWTAAGLGPIVRIRLDHHVSALYLSLAGRQVVGVPHGSLQPIVVSDFIANRIPRESSPRGVDVLGDRSHCDDGALERVRDQSGLWL